MISRILPGAEGQIYSKGPTPAQNFPEESHSFANLLGRMFLRRVGVKKVLILS